MSTNLYASDVIGRIGERLPVERHLGDSRENLNGIARLSSRDDDGSPRGVIDPRKYRSGGRGTGWVHDGEEIVVGVRVRSHGTGKSEGFRTVADRMNARSEVTRRQVDCREK